MISRYKQDFRQNSGPIIPLGTSQLCKSKSINNLPEKYPVGLKRVQTCANNFSAIQGGHICLLSHIHGPNSQLGLLSNQTKLAKQENIIKSSQPRKGLNHSKLLKQNDSQLQTVPSFKSRSHKANKNSISCLYQKMVASRLKQFQYTKNNVLNKKQAYIRQIGQHELSKTLGIQTCRTPIPTQFLRSSPLQYNHNLQDSQHFQKRPKVSSHLRHQSCEPWKQNQANGSLLMTEGSFLTASMTLNYNPTQVILDRFGSTQINARPWFYPSSSIKNSHSEKVLNSLDVNKFIKQPQNIAVSHFECDLNKNKNEMHPENDQRSCSVQQIRRIQKQRRSKVKMSMTLLLSPKETVNILQASCLKKQLKQFSEVGSLLQSQLINQRLRASTTINVLQNKLMEIKAKAAQVAQTMSVLGEAD